MSGQLVDILREFRRYCFTTDSLEKVLIMFLEQEEFTAMVLLWKQKESKTERALLLLDILEAVWLEAYPYCDFKSFYFVSDLIDPK